jgi:hypothetical protein
MIRFDVLIYQGVAQLVARPAGGREVAGSSPVTLTMKLLKILGQHPAIMVSSGVLSRA